MHRGLSRALTMIVALLTTAVVLGGVVLANETDYLGGKVRSGDTVIVPSSETVPGDLYIFAGNATVNGTVGGDLVVFGGQVTINGTVNGSITSASGSLLLGGATRGALRAAGGQITIDGTIGKDLAIAGGQLVLSSASKVGQDVLFGSGSATLNGTVSGNVLGSTGTYVRGGSVGGTEQVEINRSPSTTQPIPPQQRNELADAPRQLVAVLVVGGLILWLRPSILGAWDSLIRSRPAASFGYGLLAIIGFVAAIIVALIAVVVVAIVLGILSLGVLAAIDVVGGLLLIASGIFAFVVVCALVVDAVVGYAIGRALLRNRAAQLGRWHAPLQLALGVLIVVAVTALPVIGGIAKLLVVLFALGALTLHAWTARSRPKAAPIATG
jgi:hypothetical protein